MTNEPEPKSWKTKDLKRISTAFLAGTGCTSPHEAVATNKRDISEWCQLLQIRESGQKVKYPHNPSPITQRAMSPARHMVLNVLTKPMTPSQIADLLGRDQAGVRNLVRSMKKAGLLIRLKNGQYVPEARS